MATKTDEEKERSAFKQELLHASNWRLRKKGAMAGVDVGLMKEAEAEGPDQMVELIMDKYDEGWRPGGEALNTPEPESKPKAAKKRSKKKEEAPTEPTEPVDPDEEPLWDQRYEDDEGDDDDLLAELGITSEGEDGDEPRDEPPLEAAPEQRDDYDGEVSALEDKLDQVHDLLAKVADLLIEVNSTLSSLEQKVQKVHFAVVEHKEIAVRAWALLCAKVGVKNLSAALKKGAERASSALKGE